jgi:outer membrane protein assembly factor BamD (BamD/ComL family)
VSSSLPAVPVAALPSAPSATATTSTAPTVTASAVHGAASTTPPAASTGNDVDLAAERSLVDRARTALGRGQSSDALAALDAHAARYPHGRLSEEREALAVDALARSGRMDLALARAARFRATYPNSVFGGVVDAALAPR